MGAQQVFRAAAAGVVVLLAAIAAAGPAHRERERVATIDLGPADDGAARRTLAKALVAAGLDPIMGDGVEDALAGISGYRDDGALAVDLAEAQHAFGELKCSDAIAKAEQAVPLLATRQAAGIVVPELPRVLAYEVLCADRTGDTDRAMLAASRLRAVGGSPDVPAAVLDKYPDVDIVAGRDTVEIDVTASEPGAALWVDFAPVGTAPQHLVLSAGEHVIAAAAGTKRGYIAGTATRKQKQVAIELADMAGKWSAIATRVAGWHGVPPAGELDAVLVAVNARVALVRQGDRVEVWGHAGKNEPLVRLGGTDGVRSLAEADRAAALVADRVQSWDEHAPDPDRPLLTESTMPRAADMDQPTQWWVYASIAGAVLAGAAVIYIHDTQNNQQQIVLHYP
ncbi:MAG TPA: hypothetical protein VMJ10_19075 [Kofleriaceae bacterium]|nr:hypothetical protein [Kofleriaceae bacterium]